MAIAIVRKEEMNTELVNGFGKMELLPGTFPGVKNYKCYLQAGATVSPEKYADKSAVYCFTGGTGYVTTAKWARNITELYPISTIPILRSMPSLIWSFCAL